MFISHYDSAERVLGDGLFCSGDVQPKANRMRMNNTKYLSDKITDLGCQEFILVLDLTCNFSKTIYMDASSSSISVSNNSSAASFSFVITIPAVTISLARALLSIIPYSKFAASR